MGGCCTIWQPLGNYVLQPNPNERKNLAHGQAWKKAFDVCGYADPGTVVKSFLPSFFAKAGCPNTAVPDVQPSQEQWLDMIPKERNYDLVDSLWKACLLPARPTRAEGWLELSATLGSAQNSKPESSDLVTRCRTSLSGSAGGRSMPNACVTRCRSRQLAQYSVTGLASATSSVPLEACPSLSTAPTEAAHALPPNGACL